MTASGPRMGATTWAERYEMLRRCVLEGRQRLQSQPLGLALWMAQGMAGWMRQWRVLLEPATRPLAMPPPTAEAGAWQQPLTLLLAQITLQHLELRVSL